ncbi:TPA: hypothetical protein QCP59_004399 [Bacillus cereus]|nr:hypothetical protein [Bacillus cereus]
MKKPFYKKWWFWTIAVIIVFFIAGNNGSKKEETAAKKTATTQKQEQPKEAATPQDKIKNNITSIVKELHGVSIKEININENLGTDNPDDYIALVHLSFDAKNSAKTSKNMIETYNNDIGAKVGKSEKNVQELTIFWEVPYHQKDNNLAKANLERVGDNMKFNSQWFAPVLN